VHLNNFLALSRVEAASAFCAS